MSDLKKEIRFKNLPLLLKDMEIKKWVIDSFFFPYKNKNYIVILKLYRENEKRPSKYAKATVEFIKQENVNVSIKGYIDFYNVHFDSAYEFCEFFGVEKGNANRDLFEDFSAIFSRYIPSEKVIVKSSEERLLIGRRIEGNNPNVIYCFDVRRNGKKEDERMGEVDTALKYILFPIYSFSALFSGRMAKNKIDHRKWLF